MKKEMSKIAKKQESNLTRKKGTKQEENKRKSKQQRM